ncbi:LysR substrate-binding domain-containing protein [Paracoccus sp. CPCC 101403]|uniref:LysR substrate-binding domain-containing protein n=1 Tax=Paracoccus broussonetiae TaxID=3075834 RepID=A0ABU3EE80_9RHOB|nr:LysR substrate-binding domain-containing protein [Paracoccus sp. CPCC 101403]MDT1062552.1 LysR substrate-binding domain-containing protein [Paracoccus sp. CPCC 101403]
MEATGGVRLLDRGRRGVTPTEAGETLLHHARLILHQMTQMRGEIGQFARNLRSTVRLLANTAALTEILPARLAPWLAAHPQVDIDLRERQSVDIARSIALGFAEIGVLNAAVDTAGLELRPFAIDRLVVVAARGHALASRRTVMLAELAGEPFLALVGGAMSDYLDAQAARIGLRLRPRIRLHAFDDICRMAGAGVGIGIVPVLAARRAARPAGIAAIPLSDPWATRHLSLCTQTGVRLSPAAQDLLDHLGADRGAGSGDRPHPVPPG